MPGTVNKVHPAWRNDPLWNDPSHLRGCAEERHHELQRKAFIIPLRIHPEGVMHDARGGLAPRSDCRSYDDFERKLPQLKRRDGAMNFASDPRSFFWKDCAIYGNRTGADMTSLNHYGLLNQIYREWYPHRAEDKNISNGSFFAKYMQFYPPVRSLDFVLRFHSRLCDMLRILEEQGVWDDHDPRLFAGQDPPCEDPYRLRETFALVFIVIDIGWQERGVTLVWKNEDIAVKHGCVEDGEIKRHLSTDDACDIGEASVFCCPLKRAMQLVVSQDPYRAQKRKEYNEMLEETLGDPEDG